MTVIEAVRERIRRQPTLPISHGASGRAFTLIELLVVCAIIVMVSAIVLANNDKFGGEEQLQNFAYDVALSVRQAQVYGISVQGFKQGTTNDFAVDYGIHFATSVPTSYSLFADTGKTGLYQSGEDVSPSPYSITQGYQLKKLCAPEGSDDASCTSIASLDIVFQRPEPDAYISANGNSCLANTNNCQASARIVLESPQGDTMSVTISNNGQIAVAPKPTIAP